MSMEESISLEETNKIRISLGLKPLTDDKAPAGDKDKEAEDNWSKKREQERKDREAKKIQEGIAKVRNRRELNASLKGATLGDADEDVDDTLKWIKRAKKKEKELAKKRQEELDAQDKEILADYTERDLVGLKVSHDFDGMDEGEERILTLKDSRILDNEEDELHNIDMAEVEKDKKKQELKIKRRDYTGYDDDEFAEGNQGLMKRSILAKYDEELEGPKSSEFRLGAPVRSKKQTLQDTREEQAAAVNKSLLSIDYAKNMEINDYMQETDVGFKKPKTKKKRSSRRAPLDVEETDTKMDVDGPVVPRVRDLDANFIDDDELQAALARSRKAKLQKAKKLTPEELARKIAEQKEQDEAEARDSIKVEEEDDRGLTFDETSEFVQTVGTNPIVKPKREPRDSTIPPSEIKREKSRDVSMGAGDVALDEVEAGEVHVKEEEEEDYNMEMLDQLEEAFKQEDASVPTADDVGTSAEQTFSTGLASTLTILRQQGVLATPDASQLEREKIQRQRDAWLAQQRFRLIKKDMERTQGRGGAGGRDQSQREHDNRSRDQHERQDLIDSFKDYKPDVNIVYHDEFGRELSVKEAWKALSHKFHGKGSGKMKTEKRLKKIAEEKKREAMASGDTPLSMSKAFQMRQEKTGQAHFVLSVGNRGAVPQAADFFDAQPLGKGKTEKAKQKKEKKNPTKAEENGFMTVPVPSLNLTANVIRDTPGPSASASPAPRAGFTRIATTSVVEPSSAGGTPVPESRPKVAFGLGTKRKAGDEAPGTPPSKRKP